jgi:hypothetical protein
MRDANKMPDAFAEQLFAGNKNLNTVLTISLFIIKNYYKDNAKK